MGIFHRFRYTHTTAVKDGVGEFGFCYHKRTHEMRKVMFKPDLPGSMPHAIPDPATMTRMLDCDTAIAAMAALRTGERSDSAPSTSA